MREDRYRQAATLGGAGRLRLEPDPAAYRRDTLRSLEFCMGRDWFHRWWKNLGITSAIRETDLARSGLLRSADLSAICPLGSEQQESSKVMEGFSMPKSSVWSTWTADVEKDKNGEPLLITRWGYVKIKAHGKTYLAAASKDEFESALAKAGKDRAPDVCLGGQNGCIPTQGCTSCNLQDTGDGLYYCFCVS